MTGCKASLAGVLLARFVRRHPCDALLALSADWYWESDARQQLRRVAYSPHFTGPQVLAVPGDRHWPDDAPTAAARAPFHRLETVRDAGGGLRYLQVSGEPVWSRFGRFAGWRGVGRDVTAQKEAELALNASESQLAAVIDAAMDAIVTVDEQNRIVLFNQAAGRLFGCGRADALCMPLDEYVPQAGQIIASAGSAADAAAPRLLARGIPVSCRRRNGESVPAELSIARIELRDRRLHNLVLRDLSAQLAAEQAREALEAQLRESQKMEALGTMAGGIAHDFNNIVAAILGNAALAQASLAQPQARQFVQEIAKAGLRARDIVQRIMAFSRRQEPVFSCQALQPLVEEGVQLLRAMLPSGIEVTTQLDTQPIYVRADAAQISQVLMNLGSNASQALGSRPGHIDVRVSARGAYAVLQVEDNGCGMDEATQARIFEPFFTTKAKGEGTGLGLPVVHGIVRAHGGDIQVRSRRGLGTVFEITLPLAPAVERTPELVVAPAPPPAAGAGRHVVYIDDYAAMVFMVRATLEAQGYRVTGFEDAEEALAWLQGHHGEVDLLITDHNMPGRSGLEVAAEVHRLAARLPVILASGYITEDLTRDALQCGVRELFDKPRGIEELCQRVGRVLAAEAQEEP